MRCSNRSSRKNDNLQIKIYSYFKNEFKFCAVMKQWLPNLSSALRSMTCANIDRGGGVDKVVAVGALS